MYLFLKVTKCYQMLPNVAKCYRMLVQYPLTQAAIQIAMNRGSLSRKTRATETRTLTVRNKVEDLKVVPIYVKTTEMIADIGTKALEPKLFIYLRNLVCGYTNDNNRNEDCE